MARTARPSRAGNAVESRLHRDIATPEGIHLSISLASRGQRVTAFGLDLLIMGAILILALILLGLSGILFDESGVGTAVFLLLSFGLRAFYFIVFELRWRGRTPGKRAVGIRVIDRSGGPLRADAIFARNLMREVEIFMPLSLIMSAGSHEGGGWTLLLTLAWILVMTLMPLFNKENLRAGDMVGGTWVVNAPKGALLPDLAAGGAANRDRPWPDAPVVDYAFNEEHLGHYGVYELQTLETLLRADQAATRETLDEVCDRIRRKIGWKDSGRVDSRIFLENFYTAQRAHLEQNMMMGKRRESKFDQE